MNEIAIFVANILAIIAASCVIYSGGIKNKKRIQTLHLIQNSINVIVYILLFALSGVIVASLNVVKVALARTDKLDVKAKIVLSFLSIILISAFNNKGVIGYLPILSTLAFTWTIDCKSVRWFKRAQMFSGSIWVVYNVLVYNYSGSFFNFVNVVSNFAGLVNINKQKRLEYRKRAKKQGKSDKNNKKRKKQRSQQKRGRQKNSQVREEKEIK